MKTPEIPIASINLGTRFREDYGDIDQLCHSIKTKGLINPITVGLTKNLSEDLQEGSPLPYTLLAGGRRYTALKKLGWEVVPVRLFEQSLSSLDLRAIELAENFDRKDMAYDEELKLMSEIDRLQREIHGDKIGRSPSSPGWSQSDTARLTKKSPSSVAKDLQLARMIELHPELELDKCKNKSEAIKKLKKVTQTITNGVKAEAFTAKIGSSNKLASKLSSSYIIGDCLEALKSLPESSLDFIEIDPPYGIDLKSLKRENTCDGYNEISAQKYEPFLRQVFNECYRVLRQDSWLICWFGPDPWFQPMLDLLRDSRFKVRGIPGIWTKFQGQTQQPETYLANSYEMFFYAQKGSPKIQKPGRSNIFQYPSVPPNKKYHPTQRPFDLMVELYTTFTSPDSTGFIPFLGSGVGLLAGHHCKINMIGTDLSPSFKDGYILSIQEYLNQGEPT